MKLANTKGKKKSLNILQKPFISTNFIGNPVVGNLNIGLPIIGSIGSIGGIGSISGNCIDNESIESRPIDDFFGSIIEKPPSPKLERQSQRQSQGQSHIQIYPLPTATINAKSSNSKNNKSLPLFTNVEIKHKLDKFSEHEFCEIYKIIKNNNEKYTTNNNGIFINLSSLKKCSINEICNFIVFCENNNKIFDQEEQTRDIYREMILEL